MFRYTFVFLIGLCFIGNASAGSWGEGLFDELNHDFGPVPRGPMLSHSFRVTNKTNSTLQLGGVRVSCGCVSAHLLRTELEPGQSTYVMAQMDTRRFSGPKSVTVYVQITQPQWEEVHLVVQATGRDDFAVSPDTLAFGQVKRGTSPSAVVTLTFLGHTQCQILEARSESNYILPTVKEVRRNDSEIVYQLTTRLRSDVPVGKWYTDIWVTTNNPAFSRIRVPLTVEVETALNVTPTAAVLGEVKVGAVAERKVIVHGSKPFRIVGIQGGDGQISVQDPSQESKPTHILHITLKAAKAGEQSWKLRVLTDLKEEAEVEFQARANVVP